MTALDTTKQPRFTDAGNRTYNARSSRASSGARAQNSPTDDRRLAFEMQLLAGDAMAANQYVAYCVKFPSCGSVP
jgi:hypothetical protein